VAEVLTVVNFHEDMLMLRTAESYRIAFDVIIAIGIAIDM
jgi:hypothetical protein